MFLLNKHGIKFVGAPPLELHWCKAPKEFTIFYLPFPFALSIEFYLCALLFLSIFFELSIVIAK
jgi:hypothetical protein